MIFTSHQLPFRFFYSDGVFETGFPALLRIRFANTQAAEEVTAVVAAFVSLASCGVFGGPSIDPVLSSITMHPWKSTASNDLQWSFDGAHVCDDALVVLAHLLLGTHPVAAINLVEVVAQAASSPLLLQSDASGSTFPPEYRRLPFVLDGDDLQGDDYAFEIELEEPLRPQNEDWLNEMLAAWGRVVMLGGYAESPTSPNDAYVEPDENIVTYDSAVEWALFKLRADGASIDALLNGLAAFDGRCQRIRRVDIL